MFGWPGGIVVFFALFVTDMAYLHFPKYGPFYPWPLYDTDVNPSFHAARFLHMATMKETNLPALLGQIVTIVFLSLLLRSAYFFYFKRTVLFQQNLLEISLYQKKKSRAYREEEKSTTKLENSWLIPNRVGK